MSLRLDLRWQADGRPYALEAAVGPGLYALGGPAGASLLRLLAGRPLIWEGSARLDGQPLERCRRPARHGPSVRPLEALLAGEAPARWRTPLGLAASAARRHGVDARGARARAWQALGWAGARHAARRPLLLLDDADRRRVALARALAAIPGLLLLEQPWAPLPPAEHAPLYAMLAARAADWEMTALLTASEPPPDLPLLTPVALP